MKDYNLLIQRRAFNFVPRVILVFAIFFIPSLNIYSQTPSPSLDGQSSTEASLASKTPLQIMSPNTPLLLLQILSEEEYHPRRYHQSFFDKMSTYIKTELFKLLSKIGDALNAFRFNSKSDNFAPEWLIQFLEIATLTFFLAIAIFFIGCLIYFISKRLHIFDALQKPKQPSIQSLNFTSAPLSLDSLMQQKSYMELLSQLREEIRLKLLPSTENVNSITDREILRSQSNHPRLFQLFSTLSSVFEEVAYAKEKINEPKVVDIYNNYKSLSGEVN